MIYLDYAATTPIREEILNGYIKVLKNHYGNSDSLHDIGRESHKLLEQSRDNIAKLLGVQKQEILFTSGASESNNYAIKGYALANQRKGKHIISTNVEHSSVANSLKQLEEFYGFEITYLKVNRQGVISLEDLKKALRNDTILVSMMFVNNETGAINPVDACAQYVHEHSRARFHVDCVQAIGKIAVDITKFDMATISAHKIYGLKGSAILYVKEHIELLPLISAGQQENGLRGGTSNSPANTMFAKTLRLALENQKDTYQHVTKLNQMVRNAIKDDEDFVVNSPIDASPFILNISDLKIGSEVMLNALNALGICVSAQSTCASRSKAFSHVLYAMGLGDIRSTHAIRISFSHLTTVEEVKILIKTLKEIHNDYATR